MINTALERLLYLCDTVTPLLLAMDNAAFTAKANPDKWSKQQIMGHLLDSAVNNHQRFVRTQFEENPLITYDTDLWNIAGHYQSMQQAELVQFWALYNRHLAALAERIPQQALLRTCNTGGPELLTLDFLINDYVVHMEHHLHEVVAYS